MHYEMALKFWAHSKLQPSLKKNETIVLNKIDVGMNFSQGYACCGGRDPDCYCSFAESPSAEVSITAYTNKGRRVEHTIDLDSFDFATVLKEIIEAANGNVGLE